MPQLTTHQDGYSWQTPHINDILEVQHTHAQNPDNTGKLRNFATVLVRRLAELGTPIRMIKVEPFPSHTRYHMQPDKIGTLGQERLVKLEDIQRNLPTLISELEATAAELISQSDTQITLYLRAGDQKPLNLSTLLHRPHFVAQTEYTTFPLGMDLQNQAIICNLNESRHLLIVGNSERRLHMHMSVALTLMLFNSPSYLRLALVGKDDSLYQHVNHAPHVLGSIISSTMGMVRLLEGLSKHLSQRQSAFDSQSVTALDDYNKKALADRDVKPLPRILIMIDAVALPDWNDKQAEWIVPLHKLLNKGPALGINILLNCPNAQALPERISHFFDHRVVLRSSVGILGEKLPRNLPLQFVDGVVMERDEVTNRSGLPTPLEMASVDETEITRMVTYWQNMKTRRTDAMQSRGEPKPTGNTGLLTLRADMLPAPVNEVQTNNQGEPPLIPDRVVSSAGALAAYLGWLGTGPLIDVLGLSIAECDEVLRILQVIGVLENSDGPIWRYVRLADPLPSDPNHRPGNS